MASQSGERPAGLEVSGSGFQSKPAARTLGTPSFSIHRMEMTVALSLPGGGCAVQPMSSSAGRCYVNCKASASEGDYSY